jgi:hypothetical protein
MAPVDNSSNGRGRQQRRQGETEAAAGSDNNQPERGSDSSSGNGDCGSDGDKGSGSSSNSGDGGANSGQGGVRLPNMDAHREATIAIAKQAFSEWRNLKFSTWKVYSEGFQVKPKVEYSLISNHHFTTTFESVTV